MVFAQDGKSFATSKKRDGIIQVKLWKLDQTSGPILAKEHTLAAVEIAFSPDLSTMAVVVSSDKGPDKVETWSLASGGPAKKGVRNRFWAPVAAWLADAQKRFLTPFLGRMTYP